MGVFGILARHQSELMYGLRTTLFLCLSIWLLSVLFGIPLGIAAHRSPKIIGIVVSAFAAVLAGVPPIVLLFWLHYPAQSALSIVVDPFYTAVAALSLVGTFMICSLIRDVLREFPEDYITVGRVCGMSRSKIITHIVIPIGARQTIPGLLTFAVAIFQMTLFASFISVNEIFRTAQRINSVEYSPTEVFTALAIFCIAVSLPLHVAAGRLKRYYTQQLPGA